MEKDNDKALQDKRLGNKFWMLRSTHGREKIFSSGEMIMAAFTEFMDHIYSQPLIEHDFVGKDATEVNKDKYRTPTWSRFAVFCHVNTGYFRDLRSQVKVKNDELSKGISVAIACVDDVLYSEKYEHAAAGFISASLIGKDIGIDKTDEPTEVVFLSPEERAEKIKRLREKMNR